MDIRTDFLVIGSGVAGLSFALKAAQLGKVHGERHPELYEIRDEFNGCAAAMAVHMKKEELVLFPFIKQQEKALREGSALPLPHFGTVNNPVRMMMEDHDAEGERFRRIEFRSQLLVRKRFELIEEGSQERLVQHFSAPTWMRGPLGCCGGPGAAVTPRQQGEHLFALLGRPPRR